MSIVLAITITSPITSPVRSPVPISFKLIEAPVAFIEHQDLVLGILDLNAGNHITTYVAITI